MAKSPKKPESVEGAFEALHTQMRALRDRLINFYQACAKGLSDDEIQEIRSQYYPGNVTMAISARGWDMGPIPEEVKGAVLAIFKALRIDFGYRSSLFVPYYQFRKQRKPGEPVERQPPKVNLTTEKLSALNFKLEEKKLELRSQQSRQSDAPRGPEDESEFAASIVSYFKEKTEEMSGAEVLVLASQLVKECHTLSEKQRASIMHGLQRVIRLKLEQTDGLIARAPADVAEAMTNLAITIGLRAQSRARSRREASELIAGSLIALIDSVKPFQLSFAEKKEIKKTLKKTLIEPSRGA